MYNDFRSTSREGWKYHYKANELLEAAKTKLKQLRALEMEARTKVSDLLKNPDVSPNDKRMEEGKRDIEKYGNEREQMPVFVHEFTRNPEREYVLSLGDVTYFNLMG